MQKQLTVQTNCISNLFVELCLFKKRENQIIKSLDEIVELSLLHIQQSKNWWNKSTFTENPIPYLRYLTSFYTLSLEKKTLSIGYLEMIFEINLRRFQLTLCIYLGGRYQMGTHDNSWRKLSNNLQLCLWFRCCIVFPYYLIANNYINIILFLCGLINAILFIQKENIKVE